MARIAEDSSLLVLPEEVEEALVKWLDENLFKPAAAYRTQVVGDDKWPWLRILYDGDHFSGGDMVAPDDYPPAQVNITMPTIDTVKGIAMASPSVVEFVPAEPDDEQFAMELTAVISDYLWGRPHVRQKLGTGFLEGAIIGTAWAHTFWNPELHETDGDIDFHILPTDEVWADPACSGAGDWKYIIHAPRRPVIDVKYNEERYNDRRLLVEADQAESEGQKKDTPEDQMPLTTVRAYWLKGVYLRAALSEVDGLDAYVDDDGEKYGIAVTVASGCVIRFETHPWAPCDRLPFQRFVYYLPTGNQRVYGKGEAIFLEHVQLLLDSRVTQLSNQASLISNNQWLVSNMVVVEESELTNKPGQIVHVEGPPDMVRRIPPEGISGALFNVVNLLLHFKEIVSGMYQVNNGETPGSLRAGVAIQALQRGGEGRTRQKMDNFDEFVADIGMGMADIMAVMYDDERTFRITGSTEDALIHEEGEQPPLAGFESDEELANGKQPKSMSRPVQMSSDKFKRDGKRIMLDARAQVGLQLRSSQEQLINDMELLEGGVVDVQWVIENNRLRDKQRLLSRLFEVAQSQSAPPGGGMPAEEQVPGGEMPVDEGMLPEESQQISQTIDMLLAKMQQLEEQGVIPEGTTAKHAQAIQNEVNSGGTGEEALAAALQEIQAYMGANGSAPEFGVAGGQPPM